MDEEEDIYLLRPILYWTELIICQHFYWPVIWEAVWEEVINCDTCQHFKICQLKYGGFPDKLANKIPWKNSVFI